ncbi:MAG: hypothetical protein RLZZ397_1191 [Pseudomonadota bacterium]|jgi:arginine/ornithine transport system permease protein
MQFDVIFSPESMALYWEGTVTSIQILLLCLVFGGVACIPLAFARISSRKWLQWPVWLFTYVIRGTPLLIQMYVIYYGIAQMDFIQERWDTVWPWTAFKDAFFCTVLAFTINTCAYTVEMLAGSLRDTPHGEIEAAQAMGMSRFQVLTHITLPSALRRTLPAYSNEVIQMLQSTALVSAIPAITDITAAARTIYSDFYLPFEAFITAGVIYAFMTLILAILFKLAEMRWLAHLAPRK